MTAGASLVVNADRSAKDRAADLAFDVADDRFVWIIGRGGRRVGLIDREKATLEWVAPHPGIDPPRPATIPHVYHAPAFQGGRIVLQWWLDAGAGQRVDANEALAEPFGLLLTHPKSRRPRTRIRLGEQRGAHLTLEATHVYEGDDRIVGRHCVRIAYDPAFDSFVADVEAELVAPDPFLTEFCNLYAGGVYDNRPERKRYQCTIWQHPDGRFVRWYHNPASYLAPGMNDRAGERRIAAGGIIGYFADPHSNPVVQVIETDPSEVAAATCCNLYDEHLLCPAPAASADGLYRWRAKYRFYSLPLEHAQRIVAQSQPVNLHIKPDHVDAVLNDPACDDLPLGRRYLHNPRFPLFEFGRVNDCESPVPLDRMVVGNIIWASANPENPVYWDDAAGHSGRRSIRLHGDMTRPSAQTRLAGGPSLHLVGGQRYRLGGWVQTRDVLGAGASLRMDVIGLHSDYAQLSFRAGPCRDASEWTYLETVFQVPSDAELGWLYLDFEGPGMAWFDDIVLEAC